MARVRLPGSWLVCLGGTALILLRMLFCVASAPDRAKSIAVALDGARLEDSNQQLTALPSIAMAVFAWRQPDCTRGRTADRCRVQVAGMML